MIGLGLAVWLTGGAVFNPGPVSAKSAPGVSLRDFASHADFETQCELCHQPLNAEQTVLCQDCHTGVAQELKTQTGTHGRMRDAVRCANCHSEHRGREFDPSRSALENFDHSLTPFALTGGHAAVECAGCHRERHSGGTDPRCAACHAEPSSHAGMFGLDCIQCHDSDAWKPARINGLAFDHAQSGFSLIKHTIESDGQPIRCAACHAGQAAMESEKFNTRTCVDCHAAHPPKDQQPAGEFLTRHTEIYGSDCLQCHDGTDRMRGFSHEAVFSLTGQHASLACESCHAEKRFHNTPTNCAACHAEPEIHAGFFGTRCDYCHNAEAWQPALMTVHNFPLDHGGQGEPACETCHSEKYAAYSCYGCHEHTAENIRRSHSRVDLTRTASLEDCAACHPAGK